VSAAEDRAVAALLRLDRAAWDACGGHLTPTERSGLRGDLLRWSMSGPDRFERKILRRNGVTVTRFGLGAPKALDGRYRLRQRNRRRRRR
jgi:hypothetical protein